MIDLGSKTTTVTVLDKGFPVLSRRLQFGHSNISDEEAVGVVRLLWDGGYVAFLSDVIVDPRYQRKGIGRTLVEAVIKRIKDDMKPGYKVKLNLNSAKGKEPFYEKFGFKVRPNEEAGAGMDQWLTLEN